MPQNKNHKTYELVTHYVGERINLRRIESHFKKYKFLNRDHPLVADLGDKSYAVFAKFGTVTFWNLSPERAAALIAEALPCVEHQRPAYAYKDTLTVHVGDKNEHATFEQMYIKELDTEKIKIISYVSAQSTALDRYENEIDGLLRGLGKVVENLKTSGRTRFSRKDLMRQVGNVLHVKQSVVSALALFDKPNATWEREEIEKLYDRLRSKYELVERLDILNEKIDFLSENNTTLLNFITAQRSNYLELIVIVLIVVEILLFIPEFLKFFS